MKYAKTLLAAVLLTVTLLAFTDSANAWPRFEVVVGSPVVARPFLPAVWVEGHYRVGAWNRLVWVPGHWKRI